MKGLIVIMEQILEIQNIGKKYQQKNGETLAIKNINLKVKKGEKRRIYKYYWTKWLWKINIAINNFRFRGQNRREDYN